MRWTRNTNKTRRALTHFETGGGGTGVALVSDGKSQIAHFPQKRKLILKKLSKFGSSAGVRLCHCSNPGRSTVHRRRACPAFAKRPRGTGWAGRGPTGSSSVALVGRCALAQLLVYESSYSRQESPARERCNFSKWRPCNHGTSTTRVIIRAPSRSKRGAARCIDQTFTLNVNSNAMSMRSTCEEERPGRLTSFMKEVVLEHNRSLRSTSIFFGRLFAYSVTSSCLLDRVR